MGREFEIRSEGLVEGTPEQVWEAITAGTGGWLWPIEYEPRVGGSESGLDGESTGGRVTAWEPPRHLASRMEGEGGWLNQLDFRIEEREGGRAFLRYVHSGIFVDDWDNQYDGARLHTAFYMHTLRQYVEHFSGRPATFAQAEGPEASLAPDAFEAVREALGLGGGAAVGDTVRLAVPGVEAQEALVDYLDLHFVGLRTPDAMYRLFGRNAWGHPVGVSAHLFAEGADGEAAQRAWSAWLSRLYA